MKAFRKVTAPSLERNKIKIKDLIAQNKLEKEQERLRNENGDNDDDYDHDNDESNSINGSINDGSINGNNKKNKLINNKRSREWENMNDNDDDDFNIGDSDSIIGDNNSVMSFTSSRTNVIEKPRLNIAEKKKLKKQGMTNNDIRKIAIRKANTKNLVSNSSNSTASLSNNDKMNGVSNIGLLESLEINGGASSNYKDNRFFMSYGNEDEKQR